MNQKVVYLRLIVLASVLLLLMIGIAPRDTAMAQEDDLDGDPKVLTRGAPLHGANGMVFDEDGRLYISSTGGREIIVMDPNTGKILDRIGPERGVESPDDLAFGPDGSLYWTALFTGEVGKLAPDGTKSTIANLPLGVNPITFSDDGRLFVGLNLFGDALYELDPDGVDSPRLVAQNLGFLNGMDWGPDGYLYGPLLLKGQVVRIDVDTGEIETIAEGFGYPTALKFDKLGRLFVVDQLRGEVVLVGIQTGSKTVVSNLMPGLDNLVFDSRGRLFVSSNHDAFIVEVLPNGRYRPVSRGGMIGPGGVAVLSSVHGHDIVYVADVFNLRGFKGKTGNQIYQERSIPGGSAMTLPQTVAPDGDNLLLSSWFGNAVQVWSPASNQALETYTDFAVPLNAIRLQEDLVVAELGTGQVVRMNPATRERSVLAQLAVPAGLTATEDDLWVSDWATGSVWQIVEDGQLLQPPVSVAGGFAFPEGLAVAPDGSLLVVESGAGRLMRVDLTTGEISTIAGGLELGAQGPATMPPTWIFNGVAVGPSGIIYVTGDRSNVLYRIKIRP